MNLEEELRKTWELYELGVPLYMRGGQIEVDDPYAVSPEDAAAQMQAMGVPQVPTGPASPGEPQKGKLQRMAEGLPDTMIGGIVKDVVQGVKFFGDAISGDAPIRQINPDTGEVEISDQAIKAVTDAGGMAQLGGVAMTKPAQAISSGVTRSGFGSLPKGKITTKLAGGGGVADNKTLREMVDKGVASVRTMPDGEGFVVYHGSPHDFDRFSMDKIGTGEGAQAYGHGLYFAENEGIAKSYRDTLAGAKNRFLDTSGGVGKGVVIENPIGDGWQARIYSGEGKSVGSTGLATRGLDDEFFQTFEEALAHAQKQGYINHQNPTLTHYDAEGYFRPIDVSGVRNMEDLTGAQIIASDPGRMYEVRINADPDQFLDWDKPLSEQSEAVRKALGGVGGRSYSDGEFKTQFGNVLAGTPYESMSARNVLEPILSGGKDSEDFINLVRQSHPEAADRLQQAMASYGSPTGSQVYKSMGHASRSTTDIVPSFDRGSEASQALREAGIPGIKYLDAGSRAAGDGSRNYVVFDDKLIKIIRKYGLAAVIGGGAAAGAGGGSDPAMAADQNSNGAQ